MKTQKVKECPFCGEYHDAHSKFCGKTGKDIEYVEITEIPVTEVKKNPNEIQKKSSKVQKKQKGGENKMAEDDEEFKAEFVPVEGMEPGTPRISEKPVKKEGPPILWRLISPLLLIMGFGLFFVLGESGMMSRIALKTLCVFLEILAFGIGLALAFSYYQKDEGIVTINVITAVLALLLAGLLAFA